MNIKETTTAEGLPRIEWVQDETAHVPKNIFEFPRWSNDYTLLPGNDVICGIRTPCYAYLRITAGRAYFCFTKPALEVGAQNKPERLIEIEAGNILSFSVESTAQLFNYHGQYIPDCYCIVARLRNGGVEMVAFTYIGGTAQLAPLHAVLQRDFIDGAQPKQQTRRPQRMLSPVHRPTQLDDDDVV